MILLSAAINIYFAMTVIVFMFSMSEGMVVQRAAGKAICWPHLFYKSGREYFKEVGK